MNDNEKNCTIGAQWLETRFRPMVYMPPMSLPDNTVGIGNIFTTLHTISHGLRTKNKSSGADFH